MDFAQIFDLTDGRNILRIVCGLFLIPHLFVKFQSQEFVKGFMSNAGLNPPALWMYGAFAVEIAASIGLIFDIYTFYIAIMTAVFLLVAAYASYRVSEGKWMWNFGGAEYPLFWAIVCVVVAMQSGGP